MTTTHEAAPATQSSRWRAVLLAAVAACAACGIVYELALLTLSASLNGGGIVATSLIVAGYIAALGAGALLVKPLLAHAAIAFIAVEALLGIIGGLSAAALYVVFAFLDGAAVDVGAGGEHGPDRRPGRRRGAAADDAAAARAARPVPPTPAARWPTSTRPTTWARWSAGWSGRSSCCRTWA